MSCKQRRLEGGKLRVHALVAMAVLVAMEVILSRFLSFAAWNMKIGFAFVPVVIAAMTLGPVRAAIVCGLADFVGAILFPIGAYFPGFTLTAFLMGLVFGLLLYQKQTLVRALAAVAVNQLVLGLLVNTLWIGVLYGAMYGPLLLTRLTQCAVNIPVQVAVIVLVYRNMGEFLCKKAVEWA